MKKETTIALLLVATISFVSAYGSYSSFSLGNFLDGFDPSTMILGSLFIIFLFFIKFSLSRLIKDSDGSVNVVAFCGAALIIYGINRMGWDYENFFYDLGITSDILYIAVPILLILGLFYMARSRKEGHFLFYRIFLLLGAVAIALSFTDFVYEKGMMLTIGIILFLLGLWLKHRHKRKLGGYAPSTPSGYRSKIPFSGRLNQWKDHKNQLKERQRLNDLKDIDRQREIQRQQNWPKEQRQRQQQAQQQQVQQQQQAQQEREIQIQKVKIRSLNDLKQKYMSYLFAYYRKGMSPQQQMRMKQALVTIIQMANRQGCDTGTFLSSKIGGVNAKSPNELR